ncbi:MAG: type III toxin-antitoxin system ToxN/AbiQ family toxin [Ruminococcus sp.]
MEKLKFYLVPYDYIQYLQNAEIEARGFSRVPNLDYGNNRKQKFVCGVVLSINNIDYFAPITSYKINKPDNFLIMNSKQNKVLSSLRFNYMFPVPMNIIKIYSFSNISDLKYRSLVLEEYAYCIKNQNVIKKLANRTYKRVLLGKDMGLVYNSCDFKLLEEKCREYIQAHQQEQQPILPNQIPNTQDFSGFTQNMN